jgi:hypothetical protein
MLTEQIAVTLTVADALEALGVPYAIGGSFASSLHGVIRATMDADLVADLRIEQVAPLAQALGDAFYADEEMMRNAVRQHSSFNLIHLETMFKVDVFVAKPRAFDRSQLARRQLHMLSEDPIAKPTWPAPRTSSSPSWGCIIWTARHLIAYGVMH